MVSENRMIHELKSGFVAALPIVIGYFPVAMAFGILSGTTGITLTESFLFSVLVFAGASQFMALNLLALGVGIPQIIFTTLLVNFRHFLMSATLATKLEKGLRRWVPLIAFGVTDETFSVAFFKDGSLSKEYIIALQGASYLSWVGGTLVGYLVGSILPSIVSNSMSVGLYAMFVAILIPEAKKSYRVLVLAISSGIINTILSNLSFLPDGWSIIISIIGVSFLGINIFKEGEEVYE